MGLFNRKSRVVAEERSTQITIPPFTAPMSVSGVPVTMEAVVGLPAVLSAMRMIAEDVAKMPLRVYRDGELATDVWQATLLARTPNREASPFDFYTDMVISLLGWGNAYIEKVKSRGKVLEMFVLDPAAMRVKRENGIVTYTYCNAVIPNDNLIHIRGLSYKPGCIVGQSPIEIHREALGSYLAVEQYVGRFYRNNAAPGGVIELPASMTPEQSKEYMEQWKASHQGIGNAHKTAVLGGGATYNPVTISPKDAEFVNTYGLKIADVARIFGIPLSRLGVPGVDEQPSDEGQYLRQTLQSYMVRIEQALARDLDLFPADNLTPRFYVQELLRLSAQDRADYLVKLRQSGIITSNEGRAELGLLPVDDPLADLLQAVPVGATDAIPNNPQVDPNSNP